MVKAVTLAICSIKQLFIRNNRAKFGIPNFLQSPDIGQISEGGICDFRISGQSLKSKNCDNSKTRNDIDMKLEPVTIFDKRNATTSKKFDDDVMLVNCNVIVIF